MSGLAPKLPLSIDELDGAYNLIDDYVDLVEQNFKMLLLTVPGERIMNLDYGVGLRQYLFENQITQLDAQSRVKSRIVSQAKKYMPYIDIDMILFNILDDEPNGIHLYVRYTITPLNVEREFDLQQKFESIF